MDEIISEVGPEHSVELVLHHAGRRSAVGRMAPQDAAYLARGILACADALRGPNPPPLGTITADAHLAVTRWNVSESEGELLLTLTLQSGIDLNFRIARRAARDIGAV